MRHRSEAGISIIETLVVLVVLGVLAAVGLTAYVGALDRSRQRATMADMRIVARAIEVYAVDHSYYPDDAAGLSSLIPVMLPYSSNVLPLKDHWGHDLAYTKDATDNYTLVSVGKDGVDGADCTPDCKTEFDRDLVLRNGLFIAAPLL